MTDRVRYPAGSRVHGVDGPVCVLPAWVCLWLEQQTNLPQRRAALRGIDPAVDDALVSIRLAAMRVPKAATSAAASDSGSSVDLGAEVTGPLSGAAPLGVGQAAALAGVTARAVRLACDEGRLKANKIDGRWLIDPADLDRFRDRRAA